ncbi:MAG: hypothetical protein GXO83_06720 [Chlorobi bacterium]|nr:hypothetical protein [Chlorobiota bacterium]
MDSLLLLINTEKEILRRLERERDRLNCKHHTVGYPACPEMMEKIKQLEKKISLHAEHLTSLRLRRILLAE